MKRSRFDESRDERIADETMTDRRLMCNAHGCPNRWSISREGGRGLCSAHDRADPRQWPLVTQEQLDAQADRARYATMDRAATPSTGHRAARPGELDGVRSLFDRGDRS